MSFHNFGQYVIMGLYQGQELSERDIYEACTYLVIDGLVEREEGWEEFILDWIATPATLEYGHYRSLVYYCCCKLLDSYNYRQATPQECGSMLLFTREALKILKERETDSPYRGGVAVWHRLSTIHYVLGDEEEALAEVEEGIEILKELSDWRPGKLYGSEVDSQLKYSRIEVLLAHRGLLYLGRGELEDAYVDFLSVLVSVGKRGYDDLVNGSFPQGVRKFLPPGALLSVIPSPIPSGKKQVNELFVVLLVIAAIIFVISLLK